jgi:hypothetical protein
MRVAIVGTREPGEQFFNLLAEWSRILIEKGVIVTTGAANGCDNAAMVGALNVQSRDLRRNLHVFLPWASYNKGLIPQDATITVYNPRVHMEWTKSVHKYHPSSYLKDSVVALMARNYGIVMDPTPVDAVIALPKTLSDWGGTGQAMRIARGENVRLFNLRITSDQQAAAAFIDSL